MTNPWLSIVMPCRNGERWLAEALQSVVEQHEPEIEVVFIDGSDSEASMKITGSFAGRLALSVHGAARSRLVDSQDRFRRPGGSGGLDHDAACR